MKISPSTVANSPLTICTISVNLMISGNIITTSVMLPNLPHMTKLQIHSKCKMWHLRTLAITGLFFRLARVAMIRLLWRCMCTYSSLIRQTIKTGQIQAFRAICRPLTSLPGESNSSIYRASRNERPASKTLSSSWMNKWSTCSSLMRSRTKFCTGLLRILMMRNYSSM